MTDLLGEGEVIEFIDGSKMVGTDYFTDYIEGEGPDVILIPGLSTPRAVWDKTREQLKDRYKVHTIQTRGFGDKAPLETLTPERRTLIDTYAFHMADYIDDYVIRIGKGQNPAIIGHSMGGLVAMRVAATMGHQVEKVMVVDSLPFFGMLFGPTATADMMKPQAAAMRDAIAANQTGEADDRALQTMSATDAGRAQVKTWSQTADPKVIAEYLYNVMTTDIRPELKDITVPVTILYPWDAGVMPEAMVDGLYKGAFAQAQTFTLKRIDDSRHFIMLDQPEKFAAAVEEFLGE
ncbi:alpha/beta hydrolase [Parasphingorhabdus halotolerans]|uniref:Alpha/beta hydrolase n=2 Tax=Parasphingorhabdus halotolerans TaxID=2725558 RepID=A0A6H2DQN5_9SPHN|nr:alpha/beta hydrolase [Parasphingorhabdus halotolerans]